MLDVLVVGGGPVGLATALHLAARGLRAEVLEPRPTPIDKACGEGLMPGAVAALARLGVDPPGLALRGIRYLDGRREAVAPFPDDAGRGVRRLDLQSALAAAAAVQGIRVHRAAAGEIRLLEDGVLVDGRRARYLVGADGLHSTIRRAAGLDRPVHRPARYGLRRHYLRAPWTDHIEVHWSPGAEAYVTPVGPDEIGVAILSTRRGPWAEQLSAFPAVAERIRDAEPSSTVRGAGPLRQRASAVARGRVALVGDAAGYLDALTGEGLTVGFAAAQELAVCLSRDRLQDYPAAWRRVTWRSRALTAGLLAASRMPAMRRAIVPAAASFPPFYRAVVRSLAR
ncbi:MAG: FAD-dependent monooxygenase [Micrococcales bacterium]|nr:FAD-dependent monooxygenase [Micrococcales bacterium]